MLRDAASAPPWPRWLLPVSDRPALFAQPLLPLSISLTLYLALRKAGHLILPVFALILPEIVPAQFVPDLLVLLSYHFILTSFSALTPA